MIGRLIHYGTKDKRLDDKTVEAVSTLEKICGKSSRTIQSRLSLMKLSDQDQKTIRDSKIGFTQACVLAAHKNHAKFYDGLSMAIKNKATKRDLQSLFENSDPIKAMARVRKELSSYRNAFCEMKMMFETRSNIITKDEADQFVAELRETLGFIERLKNQGAFQTSIEKA